MKNSYFISDLHLSDPNEEKSLALLRFFKGLKGRDNITDLFLMGDIFDLWVSDYDYFIEKWLVVLKELIRLRGEGVKIHYFEGNHDVYLSDYFGKQLGFEIYNGPIQITVGSIKFYLEHGDEIDRTDYGYLFLRGFLQNSVIRKLLHQLPGAVVAWIGEKASVVSREHNSNHIRSDKDKVVKMIRDHAEKIYKENKYDYFISGHVHILDDYKFNEARAINLGSWLTKPIALRVEDSGAAEWIEIN